MSTAWAAVLLVGAGSYLLRVVPFLLASRVAVPDRAAQLLRDAGMAALAGLLATAVLGTDAQADGIERLLAWLALLVASALALAGRPLVTVVLGGAGVYALGTLMSLMLR